MAPSLVLDPSALIEEAERHLDAGRLEQAEAASQLLLVAMRDHPGTLMVNGLLHMKRQRFAEAEAALTRGVSLHPDFVGLQAALARLYLQMQRMGEAMAPLEACVLLQPSVAEHRALLVAVYQSRGFVTFSEQSKRAMTACLADPALTHNLMQRAWFSLLRLDLESFAVLRMLASESYAEFCALAGADQFGSWQDNGFLNAGLRRFLITDPAFERGLTFTRRWFFDNRSRAQPSDLALLCTLAGYCFFSEYVFLCSEDLTGLPADPRTAVEVALEACYRPLMLALALAPVSGARRTALAALSSDPAYQDLLRIQVDEPRDEAELATAIPLVAPIEGEISRAVQRQYEDNPYPRWATVGGVTVTRPDVLAAARHKKLLIAGCGTGREAIDVALIFPAAEVEALDLSRASLAYGARKARELGIENVLFRQCDVMDVAKIGKSFDLIVASGVLHHMADPAAGLHALLGVLRPRGVLKIAVYSRLARAAFTEAKEWATKNGFAGTPDGIRRFRAAILARPDGDPVRRRLVESPDFYSLSQCRDLVFHVHERAFTLPEVVAMLRAAGLAVVRMDVRAPAHQKLYRERFPHDAAAVELANWELLERENHHMFSGMYNMWLAREAEKFTIDVDWIQRTGRM